MDKEHELIGSLLSNGARKKAPAGFTESVMQQVRELEQRRIYRRVVWAVIFRTTAFVGLLLFLTVPMAVNGIRIDGFLRLIEDAGQGLVQLLKNAYFLLPLLVVLVGRKLFAIK